MAILFLRIPSSTSSSSSARRSTRQGGSRCRYAVRVTGETTDSSDGMVGGEGRDAAVATMNEASFIEPPAGCVGRHQEGSISTPLTPPPHHRRYTRPRPHHSRHRDCRLYTGDHYNTLPPPACLLLSVHPGIITTLYHRPRASFMCCLLTGQASEGERGGERRGGAAVGRRGERGVVVVVMVALVLGHPRCGMVRQRRR